MEHQTLELLDKGTLIAFMSIGSIILTLLLGLIAYFLRDFASQVKSMGQSVSTLQIVVEGEKIRREVHEEKHDVIDERLNKHSNKLENQGKLLEKHETELNELKRR
ncbi:MAG: hypothetical protein KGZ82_04175 [Bacteroidales bacterium]|nr:hypothetical protein [Bacteroidales bacterium]